MIYHPIAADVVFHYAAFINFSIFSCINAYSNPYNCLVDCTAATSIPPLKVEISVQFHCFLQGLYQECFGKGQMGSGCLFTLWALCISDSDSFTFIFPWKRFTASFQFNPFESDKFFWCNRGWRKRSNQVVQVVIVFHCYFLICRLWCRYCHTSWWKPGSTSTEGWVVELLLILMKWSQCHGVYTSYREQRRSLYFIQEAKDIKLYTSISARGSARYMKFGHWSYCWS